MVEHIIANLQSPGFAYFDAVMSGIEEGEKKECKERPSACSEGWNKSYEALAAGDIYYRYC
jgi:hypothetical protein